MSEVTTANFLPEFDRVVDGLPGDQSVTKRRRRAIARFAAVGFPTQRHEAWKYTNITPLVRRNHLVGSTPVTFDRQRLAALVPQDWPGHDIVLVDGRFRPELSIR